MGRYDNPVPSRYLPPIDCLKIPALNTPLVEYSATVFNSYFYPFNSYLDAVRVILSSTHHAFFCFMSESIPACMCSCSMYCIVYRQYFKNCHLPPNDDRRLSQRQFHRQFRFFWRNQATPQQQRLIVALPPRKCVCTQYVWHAPRDQCQGKNTRFFWCRLTGSSELAYCTCLPWVISGRCRQGWAKLVLIALERYSVALKRLTFNLR